MQVIDNNNNVNDNKSVDNMESNQKVDNNAANLNNNFMYKNGVINNNYYYAHNMSIYLHRSNAKC